MASLAAKKKGGIKLDASSALNKTSTLEGIGHHDKGDKISDGGSTKPSHPERSMLAKTTTLAAPPSQSEPRMMYGQVTRSPAHNILNYLPQAPRTLTLEGAVRLMNAAMIRMAGPAFTKCTRSTRPRPSPTPSRSLRRRA